MAKDGDDLVEQIEHDDDNVQFRVYTDGKNSASSLTELKRRIQNLVQHGRYNKVRITRNGKAILPDLPVGALMAMEVATFFGAGLLRGLIVNVVGRTFFDVELIDEADERYRAAMKNFMRGDIAAAEAQMEGALKINPMLAKGYFQLAVIRKVQGDLPGARAALSEAQKYAKGQKLKKRILEEQTRIQDIT